MLNYDSTVIAEQALSATGFLACITANADTQFALIVYDVYSAKLDNTETTDSIGLVALENYDLFQKGDVFFIQVTATQFAEVKVTLVEKDPPLYAKVTLELIAWRPPE